MSRLIYLHISTIKSFPYFLPTSLLFFLFLQNTFSQNCPETSESSHLYKLGKTRFYIIQKRKGMRVSWQGGKDLCEKHGLKLGKVDDQQTSVYVSKALHTFLRPLAWPENYYWMDAKYDAKEETYIWQDTMEPIKYSNFFYISPRPKGFGDAFHKNGSVDKVTRKEACLMISLALPLEKDYDPTAIGKYGMHTSWWERPCNLLMKSNVLCESEDPDCDDEEKDDSVFTRADSTYYHFMWPMSNRKFVVNWKPRNYAAAQKLCTDNKMKLYEPQEGDECLQEYLKNWMRDLTTYSFWTGIVFDNIRKEFVYPTNRKPVSVFITNQTYYHRPIPNPPEGSNEDDEEFPEIPVSLTFNGEKNPFNINFCDCNYTTLILSPENPKNPMGVICQNPDFAEEDCTEEFIGPILPPGHIPETDEPKFKEFYSFEVPRINRTFLRSAFKQPGATGKCPQNYSRPEKDTMYWNVDDFEESQNPYDFLTPYWMRPDRKKNLCYLSTISYDPSDQAMVQTLVKEDCKHANFFLCEEKPESIEPGKSTKRKFLF